jgi:hypothetical protein
MHDVNQIILAGVVEEYRKEIVFIMSPLNQLASRFTNSGRSHRSSLMSNTPEVSLSILTYQNVGWSTEMIVSNVDRNNNVTLYPGASRPLQRGWNRPRANQEARLYFRKLNLRKWIDN